jgi:hypothetical protein
MQMLLETRYRRKLATHLALLAMVFSVLLPGLSQAVVPLLQSDSAQVAVCTASGIKYISLDAQVSPDAQEDVSSFLMSHQCECCGVVGYVLTAQASSALIFASSDERSFALVDERAVPLPSRDWHPLNPRAPPLHL